MLNVTVISVSCSVKYARTFFLQHIIECCGTSWNARLISCTLTQNPEFFQNLTISHPSRKPERPDPAVYICQGQNSLVKIATVDGSKLSFSFELQNIILQSLSFLARKNRGTKMLNTCDFFVVVVYVILICMLQ